MPEPCVLGPSLPAPVAEECDAASAINRSVPALLWATASFDSEPDT